MFNSHNLAIKLLASLAIVLVNFCWILPAYGTTQKLQIKSDNGYRVTTVFSYDETKSLGAIAEQGRGTTKAVDYLKVSFYDPSGSMVASYDNIVNGIAQGTYFNFHYDLIRQKLIGEIDLGGESAGEIYLKGNIDQELSLIKVEYSGKEEIVTSGKWQMTND